MTARRPFSSGRGATDNSSVGLDSNLATGSLLDGESRLADADQILPLLPLLEQPEEFRARNGANDAAAVAAGNTAAHQIVFIDPGVEDADSLLRGLAAGTQVYMLRSDQDGLAQIAETLAGRHDVSDVSIIAHGNQGEIELGSTIVTEATLNANAATLRTIGHALAPGADILLYGCDTGEGSAGQQFVDTLAAATGATVAAASHLVGDVAAGDGWNLDVTSTGAAVAAPQVLSAAALNSYDHPLVINSPPTGLPISVTTFTGNTSFVESGTNVSTTSTGYLQLTNASTNQAGIAVYSQAFPSTSAISAQFTYYSGGGTGADGLSFFLLNADAITAAGGSASSVTAGGYGGGLGYSDDGQAGITNGWLGLGFDTFGNFSSTDRGQTGNTTALANEVAVRGSGTGTTGYALLTDVAYAPKIDGTRTVKINLVKVDSTHESLSVYMSADGGNTYTEVITNYSVNQALPNNFYLGFAASTGGSTDTHQIENVSVTLPVNLAVSTPTVYDATSNQQVTTLTPGESFYYSYSLTDSGPNGSSNITLQDTLPSSVTASSVHWTLQDDLHPSGSLETGTGNINLSNINLSSGDSAKVTVYGTVASTASSGNTNHTVTATPGSGFSFLTPSTGVVAMAIGSPNPYLVGTVSAASTSGTTAIAPFSAAQATDEETTPTLAATFTLKNSSGTITDANGKLSGTGLTETSTAGVYTLSASSFASFNTDLESVTFTPASNKTQNTTIGLSVSNSVSGTTPATATTVVTDTATCFLAGSHILTDRGEVVVEALRVGDRAATLVEGRIVHREIVWLGRRSLDAAAAAGIPPIRIRRNALANNVPHRDLLVTPEHCLFLEGRLIPARMLVNGRSIVEEHTVGGYSFYHVELAEHAILLAEGLAAESYLDTGNRSCFADAAVTALHVSLAVNPEHKSWMADACAPLAVDQATVQPIWEAVAQRAVAMKFISTTAPVALTSDPEVRLLLSNGQQLDPLWSRSDRYSFRIPLGTRPVRLLSRSACPAKVVGPFCDDRRRLGVAVERIVLWKGLRDTTMNAEAFGSDGWYAPEHGQCWTDGCAALDLPLAGNVDTLVDVHLASTMQYPVAQPSGAAAAA